MRGQVRIIGGEWRGRKLQIPEVEGVRPTPDRVRETLFNWLAPLLRGARCLDLFAGSGVLGFESISRGASYVALVDQSPEVISVLKQETLRFCTEKIEVFRGRIPHQWPVFTPPFDVVFLDPPYRENLLAESIKGLEEKKLLADTAYIYLESDKPLFELPSNWEVIKDKQAGQVKYYLVKRTGVPHENNNPNQ